jgi:hypothetical protein
MRIGPLVLTPAVCCGLFLACQAEEPPVTFRSVEPVCIEDSPLDGDWACGEVRIMSCEEANDDDIPLFVQKEVGGCEDADLQPHDGPFVPGVHEISIHDDAADEIACTATLEIIDEDAPTFELEEVNLWPPNHKMHDIHLLDCVEIYDCDPEWDARIIAVSSDEPENANGDGNHEPDIVPVDAQTVSLRSERQGGSNGRVYTIDFEVVDGTGNTAEGTCWVSVAHDQSGDAAIDDGPAHTVEWTE